jgi:arginase
MLSQDLDLIDAQTNLGLRPGLHAILSGTAKAAEALRSAGIDRVLTFKSEIAIQAFPFDRRPQPETRLRNGHSIREFNQRLASAVAGSVRRNRFPLVLGGDCSNILGCLLGLRMTGGRGLVHIDGHSDFFHPGNYDVAGRLGSAAGMDLALTTGRGEALLTQWPDLIGPLVDDADVVQLGERESSDPEYPFREIQNTDIHPIAVQQMLIRGIDSCARTIVDVLGAFSSVPRRTGEDRSD